MPTRSFETAAKNRGPNLLLIGAPRCASTSLAFALAEHPDLFVSKPKEAHFVAMHGRNAPLAGIGAESFERGTITDADLWYARYRGRSERYLLDASVSTMSYPETSIPNIRTFCAPEAKFLVILRCPVERAYSSYLYCVSRGWTDLSFEDSLAAESERIATNWQHLWHLRTLGRYEKRLAPFLAVFGRNRICVVVTEEFEREPDRVLAEIVAFCGLPATSFRMPARHNASGIPRSAGIGRLIGFLNDRPGLKLALRTMLPTGLRETARVAGLRRSEMAPAVRARLARDFAPTKDAIETYLGRRLCHWA